MRTLLLALMMSLLFSLAAFGQVVFVDKVAPPGGNGTSWAEAFNRIQEGIDAAVGSGGGEVWVAAGNYDEQRPILPGDMTPGSLKMAEGVDVYGGFAGFESSREERNFEENVTVIEGIFAREGLPACHVVVGASNAIIDGFVIRGGRITETSPCIGLGAGILLDGASTTVRNCIIMDNVAPRGGGAYVDSASSIFFRCTFLDNTSTVGGGLDVESGGSPTIDSCIFVDNTAISSTIVFGGVGGAIHNSGSSTLINCLFYGNAALAANHGDSFGGAISNEGTVRLTNCTVAFNEATFTPIDSRAHGGGIFTSGTLTLVNCIVWFNFPNQIEGSATITFSDIKGGATGEGNIDANPLFVNPAVADFRLLPESPAIDTGTTEGAPAEDIRGLPRPMGAGADMGAFEVQAPLVDFTAEPTNGPAPLEVQFTNLTVGATSFFWEFGDGSTSTHINPTHIYEAPGTYTVSLTAFSEEGAVTETKEDFITVTGLTGLVADFTAEPTSGPAPLCVNFFDQSSSELPITGWLWDFGDGASSSEQNPSHKYVSPGCYTVSLTVTTDSGSDTTTKADYIQVQPCEHKNFLQMLLMWLFRLFLGLF